MNLPLRATCVVRLHSHNYLKQFWTSDKILKTRKVNGAFWRHLKRFRTADTILQTRTLNGAFLRHLIRYGTAVKKIEIKDNKWYLKRFWTAEKKRTLNRAFWRGTWNDLELQRSFWHKDAFACIIVTHSETIFETAVRRNNTWFDLIKGAWCRLRNFENKGIK